MDVETDILLNQLAQEIKPLSYGKDWFSGLADNEQVAVLRHLSYLVLQAGAVGRHVYQAVEKASLRSTHTPSVLLRRAAEQEPLGNRKLREQIAKVLALPFHERLKSFFLLVGLLGVADAERRASESEYCARHWWHRDLRDLGELAEIRRTITSSEG